MTSAWRRLRPFSACLPLALAGCATLGGIGKPASDEEAIRALGLRYLMSLRPRQGLFEVRVEGGDPSPALLARLSAHGEIETLDARTLRVTPAAFRPGFEPGAPAILELGPIREAPDGSRVVQGIHRAAGEGDAVCPLTFVRGGSGWGITRVDAPGCRPRP